jgi:hypothetical protein
MEVFVRDQAEQRDIAVRGFGHTLARQVPSRADQCRAAAMLQPAVTFIHGVQQEHVARQRRLAAAVPEGDLRVADAAHIGQQPLAIEGRPGAGHHELVRHAARVELAAPEAPQFHRVVGEFVVVGAKVLARARGGRHRRGHLPAGRQRADAQPLRLCVATFDAQEHAGAVEEAAVAVEEGGAHRRVEGIHLVTQLQGARAFAVHRPAALVDRLDAAFAHALAGLQA